MGCVVGFALDKVKTAVELARDMTDTVAGVGHCTEHIAVGLGCYKVDVGDSFDRCKVDIGVDFGQNRFGVADCTGFRVVDIVLAIAIVRHVVLVRRLPGSIQRHLLHQQRRTTAYGPETARKNDAYVFCLSFLSCRSYPSLTFRHQASHQLPRLRDLQRHPQLRQSDPQLRQFLWSPSCVCWILSGAVSPLQAFPQEVALGRPCWISSGAASPFPASRPHEVALGRPCWILTGAAFPLQASLSREMTPGRSSHHRQPSRRIPAAHHPISRRVPGAQMADQRQQEHTSYARTCHGSTSQVSWPPLVQSCLHLKT